MSDNTRTSLRSVEPNQAANDGSLDTAANSPAPLLNVQEAAQFLAITVPTLYGWVWQRKIAFVKLGRALRFDIADLKRFVNQNRVHPRRATRP